MGIFLRLWNFHNLFYFAIDEEKGAYIIKGIITGAHFPLAGHPSSIGFRLGPLLYYLIAPFYFLFGAKPVVWGYVSVAASIISMILIYKIGGLISKRAGLIALILYAFSYLTVLYDRRGWQVSFHSLMALGILYSLIKLKQKWENKYFYILVALLIAASQFEVATILFIPFTVLIIYILKIKIKRNFLICGIIVFLIAQSSLALFDIRHNFINSKYLINYFTRGGPERIKENIPLTDDREIYLTHNLLPITLARTLVPLGINNAAIEYANCPQYLIYKDKLMPEVILLFVISILGFFALIEIREWKEDDSFHNIGKIIFLYFAIVVIFSSIYTYIFSGEMAEYYFLTLFGYFFIMIALIADRFIGEKYNVLLFAALVLFATRNADAMIQTKNPYGLIFKEDAVKYATANIHNSSFILDSFQTCWYSGGYRYLFSLYGAEPVRSYMDQYLNEYYQLNNEKEMMDEVDILTGELIGAQPDGFDQFKKNLEKNRKNMQNFGKIEVYIK